MIEIRAGRTSRVKLCCYFVEIIIIVETGERKVHRLLSSVLEYIVEYK